MEKTVYIYIILNPITNEVRYVGKTTNIKRRFYQHLHTKLNSYCSKWIFSLLKQNIVPEFIIIDEVTEDNWQFWETYWIAQFKSWGFNLTNLTSGGEGCNNRLVSKETRIRISNNQKNEKGYWFGKKFSDEHIKNMIRTGENHHYFNKKFSEEHKKKISLSKKGINLTTEHKIRIGNSIKGENNPMFSKKHSEESKIKISNGIKLNPPKSHKQSIESIEKIRNSRIGSKHWRSVKVINIKTNEIFDTVSSAAKSIDINRGYLSNMLNNKNKNMTDFRLMNLEYDSKK